MKLSDIMKLLPLIGGVREFVAWRGGQVLYWGDGPVENSGLIISGVQVNLRDGQHVEVRRWG